MNLRIEHGLLLADAWLKYKGRILHLNNVLLDTGSAGTLFSVEHLGSLGLQYEPEDRVYRIRGVGGSEFVFTKRIESLTLFNLSLTEFEIEVGAMNYGFNIDGSIGMDFLIGVQAVIDLKAMELRGA